MLNPFRQHLIDANESYFSHMRFALRQCGRLFTAACCLMLHALLPFILTHTASYLIDKINHDLEEKRSRKPQ
ncbi:hypothetical protein Psal006b_00681 [Piscirickettsia salmonis]|uniref:Capsule biosynthesis protein n=1 Tax=Piscirickettsia salmonis TaxID=1238 RepID=A0A1L6TE10_PISSA|nr:DUF6356 family protein [Piscirickettsia salmonis]AKP72793.1 hypothetical protein PSLF89_684 [Piscirickettsia salmonis LF-89 = ATCC VR-1361]ALB23693.1 capsule biosynthesis protein [Piscirickettsia salmonis]ALY03548.1 hypothetical protein AWE47_12380 [Piscirickettsia salmonis]AMA43114.1 hypothetical protein AWJ11_12610 [Piscirickettsia salmonis]AOS35584.1 hypothetical protein AVM72_09735 [Piscirickettsia salmonis]